MWRRPPSGRTDRPCLRATRATGTSGLSRFPDRTSGTGREGPAGSSGSRTRSCRPGPGKKFGLIIGDLKVVLLDVTRWLNSDKGSDDWIRTRKPIQQKSFQSKFPNLWPMEIITWPVPDAKLHCFGNTEDFIEHIGLAFYPGLVLPPSADGAPFRWCICIELLTVLKVFKVPTSFRHRGHEGKLGFQKGYSSLCSQPSHWTCLF